MAQSEEVAKYLEGLLLPASKSEVVHAAKKHGAPKELWKMMDKKLPWVTYQHLNDILAALGMEPLESHDSQVA